MRRRPTSIPAPLWQSMLSSATQGFIAPMATRRQLSSSTRKPLFVPPSVSKVIQKISIRDGAGAESEARIASRLSELSYQSEGAPVTAEVQEGGASASVVARPTYDVLNPPPGPSPFDQVKDELDMLADDVRELVDTDHPVLKLAASHFFSLASGKKFRPTIVMLMSQAVERIGEPRDEDVYERQRRLGQITEMIHTASLIHDDVLDEAETRRGSDAVHKLFSNKVAVLAGDFLLARASVLLARLGNVEVVEVMATALDALVTGEVMQAKAQPTDLESFDWYVRKSYFKTASLIACSCKSAALLSGYGQESEEVIAAEKFGYHLGLAFQIVDDLLDFTQSADLLGKPALSDLKNGHATAPILYAAEEYPEMGPLIRRRFKDKGDVQTAHKLLKQSSGLEKTRELALWHASQAVEWLSSFPDTPANQALVRLTTQVITRIK
ncbi:unnamed protein product [Vitrella brassicaformis CCMP3155]|uniref:Solanesyl diphosphate synthase n=2 Tax=Vitrella brassicaformis TaxID=1169539 RepID=A0A0G4FS56_VITBC|nr:unnamed protein product [Vitrella brassicaformis CCMP3155]|eukprot:CEM17488.1 unnamed protein product [Vitrella brassicaformis CCMP3155]